MEYEKLEINVLLGKANRQCINKVTKNIVGCDKFITYTVRYDIETDDEWNVNTNNNQASRHILYYSRKKNLSKQHLKKKLSNSQFPTENQ